MTFGLITWVNAGRIRVDGFCIFGVFRAELHITVAMADAARLHCQESCQHLQRSRGSLIAFGDRSLYCVRGHRCVFSEQVSVQQPTGPNPTPKSFSTERSDGFLLFRNWRIQSAATSSRFASLRTWGTCGGCCVQQTNSHPPKKNYKLDLLLPALFLILLPNPVSLPATPFWFQYESHIRTQRSCVSHRILRVEFQD